MKFYYCSNDKIENHHLFDLNSFPEKYLHFKLKIMSIDLYVDFKYLALTINFNKFACLQLINTKDNLFIYNSIKAKILFRIGFCEYSMVQYCRRVEVKY